MKTHIIQNKNGEFILFLPHTCRFFKISKSVKNIVLDIEKGINRKIIVDKYNIDFEKYEKIFEFINQEIIEAPRNIDKVKQISKLALHIVNGCNLNCIYCYANGGTYNSTSSVISNKTLKQTIDTFYNRFDCIECIQFFGGEPTLNLGAIEFVCEYVKRLYESNRISKIPNYTITTNGTCATDYFIDLINKYNIDVTVSLDGNKDITNETRLNRQGYKTADVIENNIVKLRNKTNQPIAAEVTFTQWHINKGISVQDTVDYLYDKFKFKAIHVVPVSAKEHASYRLKNRETFLDAVSSSFKNKKVKYMLVNQILDSLFNKKISNKICGAGATVFSVSAKGDIYPCFMLNDCEEYKLGNVYSLTDEFWDIQEGPMSKYYKYDRFKYDKCNECFNRTICHGCMGINQYTTGNIFESAEEECEFMRKLTEEVIISVLES